MRQTEAFLGAVSRLGRVGHGVEAVPHIEADGEGVGE
jgi:hypothetical protein